MAFLQTACRGMIVCFGILSVPASVFAGDFTIIPGKSIGKTYLGESRAQVLRTLDQPNDPFKKMGWKLQMVD